MSKLQKLRGSHKMSDKEYFAIDALSNSDFRLLKESVVHYENKELFKLGGSSISLGSAVHKLVLEPESFTEDFMVEDFEGAELNKNTKAYKEAKAEFLKSVGDRELLAIDTYEKVKQMASNVQAIAGQLLKGGVAEHAFISEFDGVPVKCKADYYLESAGVVIDLKTTKSIKDFKKSLLEYGYGTQAPYYIDVISSLNKRAERFVFILVETTAPYMVSVQEITRESIDIGREIYSELFTQLQEYRESGKANVIKSTGFPDWFIEQKRGV